MTAVRYPAACLNLTNSSTMSLPTDLRMCGWSRFRLRGVTSFGSWVEPRSCVDALTFLPRRGLVNAVLRKSVVLRRFFSLWGEMPLLRKNECSGDIGASNIDRPPASGDNSLPRLDFCKLLRASKDSLEKLPERREFMADSILESCSVVGTGGWKLNECDFSASFSSCFLRLRTRSSDKACGVKTCRLRLEEGSGLVSSRLESGDTDGYSMSPSVSSAEAGSLDVSSP